MARQIILPKAIFESMSPKRRRRTALTSSEITCYRFCRSDNRKADAPHIANMGMDVFHRGTKWLAVFSTCCVLAGFSCVDPSESRAHAAELAAAEIAASPESLTRLQPSGPRTTTRRKAPEKAYALLEALQQRKGEPLPGYVGGKAFQNREQRLPGGRYKEYDVNRKVPGRSRGAERLVIEQETGKAYYTDDHYRTFLPLN